MDTQDVVGLACWIFVPPSHPVTNAIGSQVMSIELCHAPIGSDEHSPAGCEPEDDDLSCCELMLIFAVAIGGR